MQIKKDERNEMTSSFSVVASNSVSPDMETNVRFRLPSSPSVTYRPSFLSIGIPSHFVHK